MPRSKRPAAAPPPIRLGGYPDAQAALRFLDSIVENIPDMIFVKDAEQLRFVRFNRAGEKLLGIDRAELIGKSDYDFFPKAEADFFIAKDREVLDSGKLLDIPEEPIETKKGPRLLHTKKIPILDARGKRLFLLGISEDITEKHRIEGELRRSNAALEQFAFVAAHDLQEPLRKIRGYGDLLEEAFGGRGLSADEQAWLGSMTSAVLRMEALINGLLAYCRVQEADGDGAEADAAAVLEDVKASLQTAIAESGATVETGRLPRVGVAPLHLEQVLQNLLLNAIKFRGEDAPRVRIKARREGRRWRFTVSDNGIGIPEDFLPRLFRLFEKLGHSGRRPGTGLGLAVCKKIVEGYGGEIAVESALGRGTSFTFTLPALG